MTTLGEPGLERAVVTGAAGFIGCHLVDRLDAMGVSVTGIDNERSGDWSRVTPRCERVVRDLVTLGEDEFTDICAGADAVFHLAAEKYNSSRSTPQRVIDVNVSATDRLYRGAARAGVPKLVFTSSLYAYGSMGPAPMREADLPLPTTTYGVSKVAGEHLLRVANRDSGLRWAVARLFFVYGPRQYAEGGYKSVIVSNFERLLKGERPTIYGDGEQALDYVYVDDAVDAVLRCVPEAHDGRTYNVGSGRAVSVKDLIALMCKVARYDGPTETCPPDWTAGSRRVADASLSALELGWRASIGLETGLQKVWQWLEAER